MTDNERPAPNPAEIFAFPETICHRMITGDQCYYPQAEYQGRTLYFCTEYCLRAFLADPERFYPAHSKRHIDIKKCELNNEEEP